MFFVFFFPSCSNLLRMFYILQPGNWQLGAFLIEIQVTSCVCTLVAVYLDISAVACMSKFKCHIIFPVNFFFFFFFISPRVFYNNKYMSLNRIYKLTLCQAAAIKPYIVFFQLK